jgi:hypothetical protein
MQLEVIDFFEVQQDINMLEVLHIIEILIKFQLELQNLEVQLII